MEITFDSDKDAANQRKHGISLRDAEKMDFNTAIYVTDERYDYGEARTQALGMIAAGCTCWCLPCAVRFSGTISLRKANLKEARFYDKKA